MNSYTYKSIIFYLALITLILPLTIRTLHANDLWKSLYTGRYIAQNLSFPQHLTFTFSPVDPGLQARNSWTWLGNLFLYGLYRLSGELGLQLFRFLLVLWSLVLLHSLADFETHPVILLLLLAGVFGLTQKLLLRNAIFLIPGVVLLFWFWCQARIKNRPGWIWAIPVLLTLWGNMHGSYLVGIGMLGLLVAGDFIDWLWQRQERKDRLWYVSLLLIFLLSFLGVTYLKPLAPDYKTARIFQRVSNFGVGGLLGAKSKDKLNKKESPDSIYGQIKKSMQSTVFGNVYGSEVRSAEFQFPLENTESLYIDISIGLLIITLFAFLMNFNQVRFSFFLPFLAAAVIGLGYLRTVALIPLITLPLIFMKYSRGDFKEFTLGKGVKYTAVIALVILGINMHYRAYSGDIYKFVGMGYYRYGFGRHYRLSTKVPEFILNNYPQEPMYNDYNIGSWLIWQWWPDKKVYLDSKSSAYKKEFVNNYYNESITWAMNKYSLKYAVIPLRPPFRIYFMVLHKSWRLVCFDQGMALFEYVPGGYEFSKSDEPIGKKLLLSPREFRQLSDDERILLKGLANTYYNRSKERKKLMKSMNISDTPPW